MISYFKKQDQADKPVAQAAPARAKALPEGCEALADCEFTVVSGALGPGNLTL